MLKDDLGRGAYASRSTEKTSLQADAQGGLLGVASAPELRSTEGDLQ
jgi:hypothetical protein